MRSFAFILALLASTQILAAPAPAAPLAIEARSAEANPVADGGELKMLASSTIPLKVRDSEQLSNAERFARGLPPAAPYNVNKDSARRATPSPVPQVTKRGIIQITNTNNGAVLGYISKNSLYGANYRYQPEESNALTVTFKVDVGATAASTLDIIHVDGDTNAGFPFLGLLQSPDNWTEDLGPGSYQYGWIVGTNQTPPNSPPVQVGNSYTSAFGQFRSSESAVWTIDLTTGALTAQWVNTDGSKPTMYHFAQDTELYFGGDLQAFAARFPRPIIPLVYTFIEKP